MKTKNQVVTIDEKTLQEFKIAGQLLRTNDFNESVFKSHEFEWITFKENSMYYSREIETLSTLPFPDKKYFQAKIKVK